MDLEALKEALGAETHAKLTTYVGDLIGQRDAARSESIEHRKGLKDKVAKLEGVQAQLFERLGIDSLDDLEGIDPKGQAEAAKQFEAKVKRLERELADTAKARDEIAGRYSKAQQDAALRKALSAHEWIDSDLVADHVGSRLTIEYDKVLYRTESGTLVPLEDGMQTLAKAKPHLLKAAGAGGSGYRGTSGNGASSPNPWAKETRNLTEQIALMRDDPERAAQLKTAAGAQ